MARVSKDPLICIISFRQGHNSAYIFEDRRKENMYPVHCACGIEQTWDHGVEGLSLFKVDMNQTWNDLDKVIAILIPGAVCWIDGVTGREAEWLCFSVKSWGNVSIWCMNNLDGSSWFLLLLCLRSAFSLSSAPPPSPLPPWHHSRGLFVMLKGKLGHMRNRGEERLTFPLCFLSPVFFLS